MLRVATNDIIGNFSRFYNGLNNRMFKESVNALKYRNETRHLENCIAECLLNQMSTKKGMNKQGAKAVAALLKEFTQLHEKTLSKP